MNSREFLYYWLTFSALILLLCGVVLYLSYRSGYLRDQDRARYLALWAEVPEEEKTKGDLSSIGSGESRPLSLEQRN